MKSHSRSKISEWQLRAKRFTQHCRKCGDTRLITVEHIIPIHLIMQFVLPDGKDMCSEWEDNFEYLCMVCNREKGGDLDPRHPKTYTLLAELIRRAHNHHINKKEDEQRDIPAIRRRGEDDQITY